MSNAIGEYLVESGKLSTSQLQQITDLQHEKGGSLGPLLIQLGFVGERDLATAVHATTGWPMADDGELDGIEAMDLGLSVEFLRQYFTIPLRGDEDVVVVAIADPADGFVVEALRLALGRPISPRVSTVGEVQKALATHYPSIEESGDATAESPSDIGNDIDEIAHLRDMASEAPVIRRVNELISRALELRASDIHIEPFEQRVNVRYRIDGALRLNEIPLGVSPAAVVSRVKVMASLNIAERRLPQDGRIKLRVEGREVDMRISTVPTLHGESVVMRLLDRGDANLDLASLGFDADTLGTFERLLSRPHGILLVTGPTGSGKTTTLYAALTALNTSDRKILTVEDPVEYQLEGVNQIPIRANIDLTFANALRAILRQDPDVIMIGEMRDRETARIAVQAALTGHKVFSTLHTNDAASSITRLQDMQVDDYLITSTVDAVLAQRLVRRLCTRCRESYEPDAAQRAALQLDRFGGDVPRLYRAGGCPACDETGYRGRTSILELLVMTEPLRKAILAHEDADSLKQIAVQHGMVDLHADGVRKAKAGVTSLEEIERVAQAAGAAQ